MFLSMEIFILLWNYFEKILFGDHFHIEYDNFTSNLEEKKVFFLNLR